MRISEYKIHCEMCHLLSSDVSDREFTIQVPIHFASQDEPLSATIYCQIMQYNHRLTLKGLQDAAGHDIELSQEEKNKLASTLIKSGTEPLMRQCKNLSPTYRKTGGRAARLY